jgi:dTDP-4-dehydrorhamnose 3,5-epimerase
MIFIVIVDLRDGSPTKGKFYGAEISARNRQSLFIPEGFANGFQTLEDHTEVLYMMAESYDPEHSAGIRFDDPTLAIEWPFEVTEISKQDLSLPFWEERAESNGKETDV